jgi:hypothetical protein
MTKLTTICVLLLLACPAMGATVYVSPSGTGDGSTEGSPMSWATWKGSDRSGDTGYIVGMDATISEDFYWPACQGYYAKYVQVYSTYSIGFEFAEYEQIFQWANGDIGVVDAGSGVSIVAVVPTPTTAVINTYTVDIHGGMSDTNLVARTNQGIHGSASNYSEPLNESKDISPSTPITLTAGHSYVHTYGRNTYTSSTDYTLSAAALHAVSAVPEALSFRPTYAGGAATKTIYPASQVNTSLLPSLTATASCPAQSWVEGASRVLWFELEVGTIGRCVRPVGTRAAYGTELTAAYGQMMLWTMTDQADKTMAVRNLVQAGIDLVGMFQSNSLGRRLLTHDGGGQGQSKMRFAYAGALLEDASILAWLDKSGDYVWSLSPTFKGWPDDVLSSQESQCHIITANDVLTPPWPVDRSYYYSQGEYGTVNVTNGSTTVVGNGTSWTAMTDATRRKRFAVVTSNSLAGDDKASDPSALAYHIASITDDTHLELTAPYTGQTANSQYYRIAGSIIYGHGQIVAMQDDTYGDGEETREFTAEDVGLPSWGIAWSHPGYEYPYGSWAGNGWYTGTVDRWWCKYQPMITRIAGNLLAALLLGLQDEWNESDWASFYYIDRIETVNQLDFWYDNFTQEMWEAYRADYSPAPWTPKCHTPVPSHHATAVSTSQVLSWYDGNGRASGTSCNVYFGTNPASLTQVETESTDYEYTPTLDAGTTYYWRVDEVCPGGTYTGDVWSFETEGETPPAGTKFLRVYKGILM